MHFRDEVNLLISERFDSVTCLLSLLFNLIPAVIATESLSFLPQLVSGLNVYKYDLPRYENF